MTTYFKCLLSPPHSLELAFRESTKAKGAFNRLTETSLKYFSGGHMIYLDERDVPTTLLAE